jgi:hypothetical protein
MFFSAIVSKIYSLKLVSLLLVVVSLGYYNYIALGIVVSEKLRCKYVRKDAYWTNWHSFGVAGNAFIGLLAFVGAMVFTVNELTIIR